MTGSHIEEQDRLAACQTRIEDNLGAIARRLEEHAREIREYNEHMWEARRDMDHIDKVAMRQSIDQKTRSSENLRAQQTKLLKLRSSPYFGRVDFERLAPDPRESEPFYIGVHDFRDEESGRTYVHDWRAPVASMFYDFELGQAGYEAPSGAIRGRIDLKRQFRIREGRLQLMFESGVNIVDDLLQEELGRSSDEGMKTIVATIQRDQNAIIRDADAHTLIIQGVAGSGKTSIALHRIAFLLYRFKDTIGSQDILILSPNRVFADYIGNVLPELGEEQVRETSVVALSEELLGGEFRFQTHLEQSEILLKAHDPALEERLAFKSGTDLLAQLDRYADHLEKESFEAAEWRSGRCIVPDWHFAEGWHRYRGLPLTERIAEVVGLTDAKFYHFYKRELRSDERQAVRKAVRAMVRRTTLRQAYKGFYEWLGRPELFKPAAGKLEYSDVFPLIYLKMRIEGLDNPHREIKHLLIDEMQDYSPLQYAVLGKLFTCRKTILGDVSQSLNPIGGSTAEQIQQALRAPPPFRLTRSYRSTWEIMQFALAISPNSELEPLKRHGPAPEIHDVSGQAGVLAGIAAELEAFRTSEHRSLAIIARSGPAARKLHQLLQDNGHEVRLFDETSQSFSTGAIVCSAHLAKGLEFDRVVVPDADAKSYSREIDRNLLYVACTRAMHQLTLISPGKRSPILPEEQPPDRDASC